MMLNGRVAVGHPSCDETACPVHDTTERKGRRGTDRDRAKGLYSLTVKASSKHHLSASPSPSPSPSPSSPHITQPGRRIEETEVGYNHTITTQSKAHVQSTP
ncbi:uncharacterized protein MCYG_02939 [Microsporum canis CBS 113480]|uniref:Uncharacterized protein n=1 Tax=Arthroderma otae (strain ATCC MYA-4605 / CBS 113480) TaxID=554155 RepID=C5FK98_ARTOC|nr:uncharacterized protein MCYG_02939 [Microsporum canis CBS 113480]EEQ30120.1 predicted protein [Microsporum canis CBS 113480]